jgi:hypothetical protein
MIMFVHSRLRFEMARSDKAQDGWCVLPLGMYVLFRLLLSLLFRPALPADHIVADNLWHQSCPWRCIVVRGAAPCQVRRNA